VTWLHWLRKTQRMQWDTVIGLRASVLHELLEQARAAGFAAGERALLPEVGRVRALCDRYGVVSLDEALAEWASAVPE
jgi:hypothetical protein